MPKSAADLRRHADEEIVKAVDFVPDPLDAEQRRMKHRELLQVDVLDHRKEGRNARKSVAIRNATGVWVR